MVKNLNLKCRIFASETSISLHMTITSLDQLDPNGTYTYADYLCNTYFWRTTTQQEIDYVEEANGQLHAFEFKWQVQQRPPRFPNAFLEAYPGSETSRIDRSNFDTFVGIDA